MKKSKYSSIPFLSRVRNKDGRDTPLVDNTLYRQRVVSLLYLTHSKPNLSYAVGEISRFMLKLDEIHWKVAKCIL
jgi:hypothetical protein